MKSASDPPTEAVDEKLYDADDESRDKTGRGTDELTRRFAYERGGLGYLGVTHANPYGV